VAEIVAMGSPSATGSPVIVARRLTVGHDGRAVLTGIDAFATPSRSIALIGPNGSGKSTLLRTFAGLLAPISGALEVCGLPVGEASVRIAYLNQFHQNAMALPLRVLDVVHMGRLDRRSRFARRSVDDRAAVDEALRRMEIADLAGLALRDLSGGQRQRVFLAQVLARRADLVLLDEPTSGLDARGRSVYLEAIEQERARGAVVITATHDVGEAARCDRVMLLAGRLIADGPPDEVLTPDNLLTTFGIGMARAGDRLVVTEHVHHDHGHHDHGHHDH
jgi:ABC-type Mn2+/Zn2+ transport system ATPase subunit